MSERSTGVILLGIIAVAGLGLSGYMFAKNEFLFPPTDTGSILVAYWEDLVRNTDYTAHDDNWDWLIELEDNQYNNSNYISMSNENTRFTLTRAGYYKLTLTAYLDSLADGFQYSVELLKNGNMENYIHRQIYYTTPADTYFITSSITLYSDGNDFFEINAKCSGTEDFYFHWDSANDLLSIEYFL